MSKYTTQTTRSSSSMAIDENKKKTSLLSDNSWIKKPDDEDEFVDRDPNFGKTILGRNRSSDTFVSPDDETTKTTTTSSVQALTKRFSASQDELRSSTLPLSKPTSSYTRSSTISRTSVTDEPTTSTTTTMITKEGKTTETTITTTQSVRSPVIKSPTKTETFTERVRSSSKEPQYSTNYYSPTRTTRVTETTLTSDKDAEDKLYDTLIPSAIKGDLSPTDSKRTVTMTETVIVKDSSDNSAEDNLYDTLIPKSIKNGDESKTTISSTENVTVKSGTNGDGYKTTSTRRTSSRAEDDLYDTLLPKGITSPVSTSSVTKTVTVESSRGEESPTPSLPSSRTSSYSLYPDDGSFTRTSSYTISTKPSYEYNSITSPTVYTTSSYRSSSRSDDSLTDPVYSKSSSSVYASSERTVLEKDLCTLCRKPFTGDAKIILDDMKINCHATCFKCEVCNSSLGHLKAGDSMWLYKRMVHCERCFEVTKDKWRR